MADVDIFGNDGVEAGDNLLASIAATVVDMKEAQAKVAAAEEAFNVAKQNLRKIAEDTLPALMDEAGQRELTTADGYKVTVAETVRAHIKADNQPKAFAWLIANGHDRLIQREFKMKFANNQMENANNFEAAITRMEDLPDYDDKTSVHPASLSSFVKAELEAGRDVPIDLLGVHRQRVAKVK